MALDRLTEQERLGQFRLGVFNNNFTRVSDVNPIIDAVNEILEGSTELSQVELEDGSASSPAVTFTSDPTTGVLRSGSGAVSVSSAGTSQVTFTDGTIEPVTDNDVDLGTASLEFKDLFIDGTANIDALVADTADINAGTIDNTTIGVTTPVAVNGTTITATTRLLSTAAGSVSAPTVVVGANDNGLYEVSSTQMGASVGNTLVGGFNATGAFTDIISEQTGTVGVTIDGALIKDGSFTGKQATATATNDGLTTGLLTGADQFVTVTSANANNIVCLPSDALCPVGTIIRGWVGANGFELRSLAADTTQTINNVTCGTTNEAAIPATTRFKVEKVASLTWLLTALDEVGAVITAIIPDSV